MGSIPALPLTMYASPVPARLQFMHLYHGVGSLALLCKVKGEGVRTRSVEGAREEGRECGRVSPVGDGYVSEAVFAQNLLNNPVLSMGGTRRISGCIGCHTPGSG